MVGQSTHVVVIGGGIAGSAAALALHRAGIGVTVYEQHPRTAGDLGAFLTLASNGMRALAQIGLAGPVGRAGFGLTEFSAMDESGTVLMTRPLGEHADPLTRFRCLRWSELTAALQSEVVRQGITLRHGASFVSARTDDDAVTATFADGSTVTADLLLGADGIGSGVRALIDPGAATPRYAGQRVFYGYTDVFSPPTGPGRITMVRGKAASFGYTVSPEGLTYWFARQTADALPDGAGVAVPPELRAELIAALRLDSTPTAGIVEATGDILVTNTGDLPDVAAWSRGRMLLIGDAAHAASPATGQGASMAFEDAVVLAKALRDSASVHDAVGLYEAVRRPRTQRNMDASAAMSKGQRPPSSPSSPTSPAHDDETLARQIDWDTPLTA
ncbi:FAD-dependent oxidoreductase [Kineosporia sp. J2-2]|uniref:FAD-dependent oxidoreductase n=1 Tax=Kineosporia corallincola TaxID=2835133 RepID=A0ABS5TSF6_9ACTN|nr:FAD-dependent oxidoreductase [Kineosporia corallincola]MBT0773749.1 FAD-dependent oxidoreductase [Kineosporia corallincola]